VLYSSPPDSNDDDDNEEEEYDDYNDNDERGEGKQQVVARINRTCILTCVGIDKQNVHDYDDNNNVWYDNDNYHNERTTWGMLHIGGRGGWSKIPPPNSSGEGYNGLRRIYTYKLKDESPLRGGKVVTFYSPRCCKHSGTKNGGDKDDGEGGGERREKNDYEYGSVNETDKLVDDDGTTAEDDASKRMMFQIVVPTLLTKVRVGTKRQQKHYTAFLHN